MHILGEGATELIHIGQAVLNLKGGVDYFIQNTFNYPTLAEAYKIAGLDAWNRMTRLTATSDLTNNQISRATLQNGSTAKTYLSPILQ